MAAADPPKTYAEWIAAYVAKHQSLLGLCSSATTEMVAAFPELQRVPGRVLTAAWGEREHWWCVAPDGTVVDPTASQFPGGVAEYIPWRPGSEVRVGKCINCGEVIYARPQELGKPPQGLYSTSFCDARCYEAAAAELL